MTVQKNRHYRALELDKILERLAEFTACDDARFEALNLEPQSDINLARAQVIQTSDAHMLLARDPATPDNCGLPYTGPVSMQLVVGAQVYVGALTIDLAAPAAVAGWADGPLLIPASAPPGPATLILDFPGSDSGPIRASIVVLAPPSAAPTPVAATPNLTG